MERYKIALSAIPHQEKLPGKLHMMRGQKSVVDMEISEILIKGAFLVVQKDQ